MDVGPHGVVVPTAYGSGEIKASGSKTPSDQASGCFWSRTLKLKVADLGSDLGLVGLQNTLA